MSELRNALGCLMFPWRLVRYHTLRGGWLPDYLLHHKGFRPRRCDGETPIDVVVTVVDHFEPASRSGPAAAADAVAAWCDQYAAVASRHRDIDGRCPQHTWFYRAEYPNPACIAELSSRCFDGFGEIEFHLHHGHDTHATFGDKLRAGLAFFNQAGAMLTAQTDPRRRFAYIAGNWALDNGAGDDAKSGCNTELSALDDAGCYADFTFPAKGSRAQPRKINAIYYATCTPEPKSYDTGVDVRAGGRPSGDLMIFEGPLTIDWRAGRIEDGALEFFAPPSPARMDQWLRANVHVKGRPEWLFVKLHCHGVQSQGTLCGPEFDALCEAMTTRWNRPPFRLHFATAREAYNMVKAAEAGCRGNPNDYRDFVIPQPANRKVRCDRRWKLLCYDQRRIALRILGGGVVSVEFAEGDVRSICGRIARIDASLQDGRLIDIEVAGKGEVDLVAAGRSFRIPTGRRVSRGEWVPRCTAPLIADRSGDIALTTPYHPHDVEEV